MKKQGLNYTIRYDLMVKDLFIILFVLSVLVFTVAFKMLESRVIELELEQGNMIENYTTIRDYNELHEDVLEMTNKADEIIEWIEEAK